MATTDAAAIQAALAAPFDAGEVRFKPQAVKGNRALAIAYLDARAVQDRLDEVVGVAGWRTEYIQVGPDSVECRLSLLIDDTWITKADVGSTSEQPDAGDRMKAAYSDALKRAAVAFGIGRFLYRLGGIWADYDPVRKQFTSPPTLPRHALPGPVTHARQALPPVNAPRPQLSGTVDNPGARGQAIEAYAAVADMAEFRVIGQRLKALKEAGKFSDADLAAIREAAGAAQDRLARGVPA